MAHPDDSTPAAPEGQAEFDTGCVGCLAIIIAISAGVFALAAVDSALFADIADTPGRRNWIGALAPFRLGEVNIGALLLAAYLVFEMVRLIRKLADPRAVWIDGDRIRFHPSLRLDPVPLSSLAEVSYVGGDVRSMLVLRLLGGRKIEVKMVDNETAAAFVDAAERARAEQTFG